MTIYNLEESPDLHIVPRYYNNKFVYQMALVLGEMNRKVVRTIDLRNDKLMVYGTEIAETVLEKLHQSLVLRPKQGVIYVNCNGACYFLIPGKGCYRPIHNKCFDWSAFGVVAPNLEGSKEERENLKAQISSYEKEKRDMEGKIGKLDFELRAYMAEVKELQDVISYYKKEKEKRENLLNELQDELESSKIIVKEVQENLCEAQKERECLKEELQKVHDQLGLANSELESTKVQVDLYEKQVQELQDRQCHDDHDLDIGLEFRKMLDHLLAIDSEMKLTNRKLNCLLVSMLWNGVPSFTTDLPIFTPVEDDGDGDGDGHDGDGDGDGNDDDDDDDDDDDSDDDDDDSDDDDDEVSK